MTKGRPAPPPEAPPLDPVVEAHYTATRHQVSVALAACFGSDALCVRPMPEASSWLLKQATLATLVEGVDHTSFVLSHLQQGQWGMIVVDGEARVRVLALAPGEELRAALLSVWGTLERGVALVLGAQS